MSKLRELTQEWLKTTEEKAFTTAIMLLANELKIVITEGHKIGSNTTASPSVTRIIYVGEMPLSVSGLRIEVRGYSCWPFQEEPGSSAGLNDPYFRMPDEFWTCDNPAQAWQDAVSAARGARMTGYYKYPGTEE